MKPSDVPPASADPVEIARAVGVLHALGAVVELRVPGTKRGTLHGYFDDRAALAEAAAGVSGTAPAVYATINAIRPDPERRVRNRVRLVVQRGTCTRDADIARRRWLPLDFDPVRPAGTSSTAGEWQAAVAVARTTRGWLVEELGVPLDSIVLADSGNGGHLLVRISLPNDGESWVLVMRCIQAIALRQGTETVTVDRKVGNAARIWKVYGTRAAKGEATAERPHRLARMLEVPEAIVVTPRAILERLAALAPLPPAPTPTPTTGSQRTFLAGRFDVRGRLAAWGLVVTREVSLHAGAGLVLDRCGFNPDHKRGEAMVTIWESGTLTYTCPHHGCLGRTWNDLRARYDARYRRRGRRSP